ncbi:MAG: tripartite tricarboxylate transporter permease [Anaerolineae bacterium]
MRTESLWLIGSALTGALFSSFFSCLPALHITNVAGLFMVWVLRIQGTIPHEALAGFMLGLVVGYAVLNTIPSVFWGAPDESTVFIVWPGQKYLMQKRGFEASALTGIGSLGGLFALLILAPFLPKVLPTVRAVLTPHLHWILAAVTVFMLMSEWPKGSDRGRTGLVRFLNAWQSLGAGLLTFLLSGILGFVLLNSNLIPAEMASQKLMPALIGLFGIPWVLQNILSRVRAPTQELSRSVDLTPLLILRGVGAGAFGGLFAAFFPAVTGGIGAFLAGHATAQRDDRLFLISQGASKVVYYVGAFLFFFVPGSHLTRGGMAGMLSAFYTPYTPTVYWGAIAAMLLAGSMAFILLLWLSRVSAWLVTRVDYRWISALTLMLLVGFVLAFTGWEGLLVAMIATGIGLVPVLWGSRRMNCMGVLLLPLIGQWTGLSPWVAGWFGLK